MDANLTYAPAARCYQSVCSLTPNHHHRKFSPHKPCQRDSSGLILLPSPPIRIDSAIRASQRVRDRKTMSSLQPSIRTLSAPPYTISVPSEGRGRAQRPMSSPTKKGASGDTQSRRWTRFRAAEPDAPCAAIYHLRAFRSSRMRAATDVVPRQEGRVSVGVISMLYGILKSHRYAIYAALYRLRVSRTLRTCATFVVVSPTTKDAPGLDNDLWQLGALLPTVLTLQGRAISTLDPFSGRLDDEGWRSGLAGVSGLPDALYRLGPARLVHECEALKARLDGPTTPIAIQTMPQAPHPSFCSPQAPQCDILQTCGGTTASRHILTWAAGFIRRSRLESARNVRIITQLRHAQIHAFTLYPPIHEGYKEQHDDPGLSPDGVSIDYTSFWLVGGAFVRKWSSPAQHDRASVHAAVHVVLTRVSWLRACGDRSRIVLLDRIPAHIFGSERTSVQSAARKESLALAVRYHDREVTRAC
ncbi:hypothetical protein MKEN_00010200 [Mycena kentingensis (nom. inval.)]|nr:hypothetical protein MKEN_00010200 [Mycena kentingensis (nom. inval.)]